MYQTDKLDKEYATQESSRLNIILKTGSSYGASFLNYIKEAFETYRMIFKYTTSIETIYKPEELLSLCKKSVVYLMKATIVVCENKEVSSEILTEINAEFIDSGFSNQDITEFVDTMEMKESKESPLDLNDVKEICKQYFRVVKSSISNIQRFMKYNLVFTLDSKRIYTSDKQFLNEIRRNFYNENYSLSLSKVNSLIKKKLRDIIYIVNCILFGTSKWRRGIPPEINKILSQSFEDTEGKSILDKLKLEELAQVCLNLNEIQEKVFTYLFDNDTWKPIKETLFLEKDFLLITPESKVKRKKEEMLKYLLQARLLTEKIDSFYYKLFRGEIPFIKNFRDFKISEQKLGKMMASYNINKEIITRIELHLEKEGKIELDLDRFVPHGSFPEINFVDWIMYIYHMNKILKIISINIIPSGKIIIT